MHIYTITYDTPGGVRKTILSGLLAAQAFIRQLQASGHAVLEVQAIN